jgi:methionyl-tRNA formyltransferase
MKVAFMGSPEIAATCLRALAAAHEVVLVVSQPDKPAGRGGKLTPPAVKVAAESIGLRVIQPKSARTGELEQALTSSGAELAAVVAYGKILPPAVLTALPRGCINVHASLLPRYRGAAPIQWAVINGDAETGVAIMQLDEGMDTGPVYFMRATAIDAAETSGELMDRLAAIGATALVDAIDGIAAGTLQATPQQGEASHARMLEKSDGAIDFARPAGEVAARIRGVDPWPGAFAQLRRPAVETSEIVKLFRAHAVAETGMPGTILAIDAGGMRVACGEGAVVIRDVQVPNRKRMTAAQLANGRGIAVGDVLFSARP